MKKLFLLPILLLSLISTPCLSETMASLVERDGIYYKKFTEIPFTGKVTGGSIKDGKKEGKWVEYWGNGQLLSKENYKNGKREGESVHYYDSGQVRAQGSWKNGKKEGKWVFYDSNGIEGDEDYTGTFKDGKKVSD